MTRRELVLTLGTSLCLSLAPACSYLIRPEGEELPPTSGKAAVENRAEEPTLSPRPPDGRPELAARPIDSNLKQIHHPAPAAQQALLPEPPTRAQAEAAARQLAQREPQALPESVVQVKAKPIPDPAIVAALRCFLDKRPAEAVMWLDRYDRSTQELLLCLLPMVARLSEGTLKQPDPRELTASIAQLDSVTARLRPRAALAIDKLCFSNRMEQFGVYQARDENDPYAPGDPAELYVELRNFTSTLEGSKYAIRLNNEMDIRKEDGNHAHRLPTIQGRYRPLLSQSQRHDLGYRLNFRVPPDLPNGHYTLWLYVTDIPTGRRTEKSVDFCVVAPRD